MSTSVDDLAVALAGTSISPLAVYFSQFSGFTYNPGANAATEFRRLKRRHGDNADRDDFNRAFEAEFNTRFGCDEVWDYSRLCARLDIDPIPPSKTQARKVRALSETFDRAGGRGRWQALQEVDAIHINIYDLEHYDRLHELERAEGAVLRRFDTVKELAKYSKRGKVYPRDLAKAKGALRFLLRRFSTRDWVVRPVIEWRDGYVWDHCRTWGWNCLLRGSMFNRMYCQLW
jgi:hypothetical protein